MSETWIGIYSCVKISLIVGAYCTILGFPIAVSIGWILARWQFRAKTLVSMLCLTPVVLPPVVTGFFILRFFSVNGRVGGWLEAIGIQVPFTLYGAFFAAFTVGLPFYIMGARAAFEAVDEDLENVSKTLGWSPSKTFLKVSLPLALPGIASGAVMAFARSLGEFGATAVVAGNMEGETRTIALAIYTLLESPRGEASIRVLVILSLVIAFSCLIMSEILNRMQRRRLEG